MEEELIALAEAGATALVATMATDVWQGTRSTVLGLFRGRRRSERAEIEAHLDSDATLVREAPVPDGTRHALSAVWSRELAELLCQDPAVRDPLIRMVESVALSVRPPSPAQINTAHNSGTVFAVQHGTQHVNQPESRPCGCR